MKIFKFKRPAQKLDAGFTLVESMGAMVIMGIVLAYALPLYMFSRIKIQLSQQRSESLILTQKIITKLERTKISELPTSGTVEVPNSEARSSSVDSYHNSKIAAPEFLRVGGRVYDATITYCPTISGGSGCRGNYRELTINIKHKGSFVYEQQVAISEQE